MITPTQWTDNNLTWDAPNPLWDLWSLNLAVIEAIKEKDSATGRAVPALLSASYNPIRPNWDYVSAIHAEVSALIPLFVNHLLPTAHPGDYNGEATIPMFTEATILAAIGDSARIVPTHLSTLSAWYFQTRKILDMLRWGAFNWSITSSAGKEFYGGLDWDNSVIGFNSLPWIGSYSKAHHNAQHVDPNVYIVRARLVFSYTANQIPFDFDFYSSFDAGVFPGTIYVNSDYNAPVTGRIYNIGSGNVTSNSTSVFTIGNIEAVSLPDPVSMGADYNYIGWASGVIQKAVHKFDGDGGFNFKST